MRQIASRMRLAGEMALKAPENRTSMGRNFEFMRGVSRGGRAKTLGFLSLAALVAGLGGARAETIAGALSKAYFNNPDINQQRAAVRASDENVPKANAGFLPTVSAQASAGYGFLNVQSNTLGNKTTGSTSTAPREAGLTVTQNLWNGNRTINSLRQAESGVMAARETLRITEQSVLLDGVTHYMDVLRDTAILSLTRNNVDVLKEQLRQTNDRFTVGEVTRTDVAQAQASLAGAEAAALTAQSNLQTSIANYRQTMGDEPKNLSPVKPLVKPLPKTLSDSISIGYVENPSVTAALHGVDVAALNIKIIEGALYPSLGLTGSAAQNYEPNNVPGLREFDASVVAQLNIPIYDGGATYAGTRQAKETLGQQELQVDLQRNRVRAAVVSAWGANEASTGVIKSSLAQVAAAEVALAGVREEAKVGQRTTLDVLNAQQTLLSAREQLVAAQHDQVVNSYSLLSAVGRLSTANLGIALAEYDPKIHFNQVKDKWFGLRTPDGR
jgi:outer membrane protein